MDCESCRHLTVVGLHDTSPWRLSKTPTKVLASQTGVRERTLHLEVERARRSVVSGVMGLAL